MNTINQNVKLAKFALHTIWNILFEMQKKSTNLILFLFVMIPARLFKFENTNCRADNQIYSNLWQFFKVFY